MRVYYYPKFYFLTIYTFQTFCKLLISLLNGAFRSLHTPTMKFITIHTWYYTIDIDFLTIRALSTNKLM